jgi:hypothetical protein
LLRVLLPLPKQIFVLLRQRPQRNFYEVKNIGHKYLPDKFIDRLKIFQTAFANPQRKRFNLAPTPAK